MSDVITPTQKPLRARLDASSAITEHHAPRTGITLPQLPPPPRRRRSGLLVFILMVVVPTLLSVVYFNFIAAKQYETTAIFALRVGEERDDTAAREGSLVGAFGPPASGAAVTQSYGLARYIASAPAVEDITRRGVDVRGILSNPLADPLVRLPPDASLERLMRAWHSMVRAEFEITSGVVTLKTYAYTPEDSFALTSAILASSEGMINQVSSRAHTDALKFAEGEVQNAEQQVASVRARLQALRTTSGVLDPTRSTASNVELEGRLRQDLMQAESQADSLRASGGQNSPAFAALNTRIRAMRQQLSQLERQVSRNALDQQGSGWATVIDRHEALQAELRRAESRYTTATENLQIARNNAVRQGTYLLPFVRPVTAVEAAYPRPWLSPLIVAGCAVLAWAMSVLLYYAVRDHA
jgi:capsular polysaccharide transport system permease protein